LSIISPLKYNFTWNAGAETAAIPVLFAHPSIPVRISVCLVIPEKHS
jgi:hypothetical protein